MNIRETDCWARVCNVCIPPYYANPRSRTTAHQDDRSYSLTTCVYVDRIHGDKLVAHHLWFANRGHDAPEHMRLAVHRLTPRPHLPTHHIFNLTSVQYSSCIMLPEVIELSQRYSVAQYSSIHLSPCGNHTLYCFPELGALCCVSDFHLRICARLHRAA
jgi:hypothetical protein